MRKPIRVTVDDSFPVAYIEYRDFDHEGYGTLRLLREPDGSVRVYGRGDGREDEGTGVHLDVNADDDIVGIEIISIDEPELVAIARDFAAENDLAFPVDIRAATAAGDPAA